MKLKKMPGRNKYIVGTFFYSFILIGSFYSLLGSVLPMMKVEYQLDYQINGMLMSVLSAGYLVSGASISIVAKYAGFKRTYVVLSGMLTIGLLLMILTPNPAILLVAMLIAGFSRGGIDTFANQTVSNITDADGTAINLLQACYSLGSCIAPLIVLAFGASWKKAIVVEIVFCAVNLCLAGGMKAEGVMCTGEKGNKTLDFDFFHEKLFWICTCIFLFYLCIEDSLIGWMVTFLVDEKSIPNHIAQMITTMLWASALIGRLTSAVLSQKFSTKHLLVLMCGGAMLFFALLMLSSGTILIAACVIGMGIFMAGIYGTGLANSGDLLERYPLCMGVFIAIPGVGAMIVPGVVGILASHSSLWMGMLLILTLWIILFLSAIINYIYKGKYSHESISDG